MSMWMSALDRYLPLVRLESEICLYGEAELVNKYLLKGI